MWIDVFIYSNQQYINYDELIQYILFFWMRLENVGILCRRRFVDVKALWKWKLQIQLNIYWRIFVGSTLSQSNSQSLKASKVISLKTLKSQNKELQKFHEQNLQF